MTFLDNILERNAFPKSVFSISQNEYYGQDTEHLPLKLTVKRGGKDGKTNQDTRLPDDIHGHVFIIAAAGSVDLDDENDKLGYIQPAKNGFTSLFNGDGILYRLDFHSTSKQLDEQVLTEENSLHKEQGKAWLAIRLLKTPDYYIDEAINNRVQSESDDSKLWKQFQFITLGIARVSLQLGTRNQLNTALLRFISNGEERLLATWDNGRPFEVDPYSLKLIGAVGHEKEWMPMVSPPQNQPLKPTLTSAHPVFDPETGDVFTTNVSKTLFTLLKPDKLLLNGTRYLWRLITRLPPRLPKDIDPGEGNSRKNFFLSWPRRFVSFIFHGCLTVVFTLFGPLFDWFLHLFKLDQGKNEIYLLSWNGEYSTSSLKKWKIQLPSGKKIEQTVHQIGITKDYVILCDTAFKIMPELFIPDFVGSVIHDFLDSIRNFLSYPQVSFTDFYIVSRADLEQGDAAPVKAVSFRLPREVAHFEVEYQNQDNEIVLFAANINATDPAEYIRSYDESVYSLKRGANEPISGDVLYYLFGKLPRVILSFLKKDKSKIERIEQAFETNESAGHCCAPTDVNSIGCYVIDTTTGNLMRRHEKSIVSDVNRTWALSFPAYRDRRSSQKKIENIYWGAWGLWNDMLSADIFEMYESYRHRQVTPHDLKYIYAAHGVPASISHVQVTQDQQSTLPTLTLNKHNFYDFPNGYFGTSPTFVPKLNSQSDEEGYIVCTVIYSNEYESRDSSNHESNWSKNSEIWIFDAQYLKEGPKYCLSHPNINFGLTIHTSWMETLPIRRADSYDVIDDYKRVKDEMMELEKVKELGLTSEIESMLDNEVFPKFQQNTPTQ